MKKRALSCLLFAVLLFLSACTSTPQSVETSPPPGVETPTPAPTPTERDPNGEVLDWVTLPAASSLSIMAWMFPGDGPRVLAPEGEAFRRDMEVLFAAYDWARIDPPKAESAPKGGAGFSLALRGNGRTTNVNGGSGIISCRKESGQGIAYYRAPGAEALCEELMDLWPGPESRYTRVTADGALGKDEAATAYMEAFGTRYQDSGAVTDYRLQDAKRVQMEPGEDFFNLRVVYQVKPAAPADFYWKDMDADDDGWVTLKTSLALQREGNLWVCVAFPPHFEEEELPAETPAPTPTQPAVSEANQAVLGRIDAIAQDRDMAGGAQLEYFADGGSGPSLSHRWGEDGDIEALTAIFSAYDWEKTEEPPSREWTEEMNPPEGGAYRIRLRGKSGFCDMDYRYSNCLSFKGDKDAAVYYTAADYDGFYEAIERFCYRLEWRNVRAYLWEDLNEGFSGRTLTLHQPGGQIREILWADSSSRVQALVESHIWVFLPEGSQKLDRAGERLTLSTGEEYGEMAAYAQDGYLQIPGYLYKPVDKDGNPDLSFYTDLCKLLAGE